MFTRRIRLLILNAAILASANLANANTGIAPTDERPLDPGATGFHAVFDAGGALPGGIWPAGYAHPDSWNDTAWSPDRAIATPNGLRLDIGRERARGKRHTGAEMHVNGTHHYGRYEVVMQPARGEGLVSAFFTFTGPMHGTPKDEIDIEFTGRDTTRVQLNYFTSGKSYGGAWIELPYDAADHLQLYAFEWDPDEIRFFIGDQLVHVADGKTLAIPSHAGSAMFSLWAAHPRLAGWTGPIRYEEGASATFHCVSYAPPGDWGARCSDHFRADLPPVELPTRPGA